MGLFLLMIFFSFFVNNEYNVYGEGFLLSFYFFLFFFIIYISLKSKFKLFYVLRILRKYVIFLTLFKVNLSYNNLLKFFLVIIKSLFKRFNARLKICKHVMNLILTSLFNKYDILTTFSFLCCFNDASNLIAACSNTLLSLTKVVAVTSLNDSRLYI
jgi:hypothetical protein